MRDFLNWLDFEAPTSIQIVAILIIIFGGIIYFIVCIWILVSGYPLAAALMFFGPPSGVILWAYRNDRNYGGAGSGDGE